MRSLRPVRVLKDDDPEAAALHRDGWRVVAESWGARLVLDDGFDPAPFRSFVERAEQQDVAVAELDEGWTEALLAFEAATHDDYPVTPATPAPPLRDGDDIAERRAAGWRVFGAVRDGVVLAASWIRVHGDQAETETTAVLATERRRGLAVAVKAASVLAAAADGARTFATGGAGVNAGSIAMNQSLGYTLTERWLSLSAPEPSDSSSGAAVSDASARPTTR